MLTRLGDTRLSRPRCRSVGSSRKNQDGTPRSLTRELFVSAQCTPLASTGTGLPPSTWRTKGRALGHGTTVPPVRWCTPAEQPMRDEGYPPGARVQSAGDELSAREHGANAVATRHRWQRSRSSTIFIKSRCV